MEDTIRDPSTGLGVAVTPSPSDPRKGLLNAVAIAIGIIEEAVVDGVSYQISTGKITLTSALKSAVFFIKNNGEQKLNISLLKIQMGISDSPGAAEIVFKKNSATGTIIDNALAADIVENKNFGRTNTIVSSGSALIFKGVEGDTVNGSDFETILTADAEPVIKPTGSIILEPGNSFGIEILPPVANTSMVVIADMELFISN